MYSNLKKKKIYGKLQRNHNFLLINRGNLTLNSLHEWIISIRVTILIYCYFCMVSIAELKRGGKKNWNFSLSIVGIQLFRCLDANYDINDAIKVWFGQFKPVKCKFDRFCQKWKFVFSQYLFISIYCIQVYMLSSYN